MPGASYLQSSFLGGEISKAYSGRYDLPGYRISLSTCLNWIPIDTGALVRRGGTQFCSTTRSGNPGRNIAFDVAAGNPIYMEFTDLFLRFRLGPALVTTNDAQAVVAISTANPAVVQTTTATNWATGDIAIFSGLGPNNPLLQNRQFLLTKVNTTHFSLKDAITGATIDGSTLGTFASGTISRVLDIATTYASQSWQSIRSVQAETQTVLLNGVQQPQVLTMLTPPSATAQPTFSLAAINFIDGPYLDPFPGSIVTYDVLVGNVTLTFTFQAYSASVSYNAGDYVLSGGVGYKSLVNANLNNTPASSPTDWLPVQGGDPVNSGIGFTPSDIGRHIRLFSEPPPWVAGTTYGTTAADVVKYNGAYYQSVASSNTGNIPESSPTKWALVTGSSYAVWTWGRIISISGSGLISPNVAIGNFTSLSAAFDSNTSKGGAASATKSVSVATAPQWHSNTGYSIGTPVYDSGHLYSANFTYTVWQSGGPAGLGYAAFARVVYAGILWESTMNSNFVIPNTPGTTAWLNKGNDLPGNTDEWTFTGNAQSASIDAYAGQDFHSSTKQIAYAQAFASIDLGFTGIVLNPTITLRAKHTVPASPSDGTILGSATVSDGAAKVVTIQSNDTSTAWEYFWLEMTGTIAPGPGAPLPDNGSHIYTLTFYLAQAQFFQANVANGSVVTIQLAGPALLYQAGTVINTWRAGVYSNTTGWPTCGTYAYGRLWLGGVVDNRFDASVSNNIFTFSPTGPDGTVAANNAISETLNAPDVNPILWMLPDLQGVFMGTQKREWLIAPASTASGIGPTNIVGNPATHIGSANIEPRRTDHTMVFVQKHQRKILEAFPDVFSGKFTAPNLLEKARHLTSAAIQEIAYAQELNPTIWARCGDGSLFGIAYKRDTLMTSQGPTFAAPFRVALGSGRLVESIAVGPSPDGTLDSLMLVTNDQAGVRHVELMTQYFEEVDLQQNAWQLDSAVNPTSTTSSNSTPAPYGSLTINGLWHLNGKTVQIFAGGLDCGLTENGVIGDFTVTNGSVTVPYGDGVSAGSGEGLFTTAFVNSFTSIPIVVGFTYNSDAQLLRPNTPQESGARNGPALGKTRRNHDYALQVVNTQGLSVGTSFAKLYPVIWQDDSSARYPDNALFTGVQSKTFDLDDTYSFDGQICWRASRVQPAMVTAVGGFIETQDR